MTERPPIGAYAVVDVIYATAIVFGQAVSIAIVIATVANAGWSIAHGLEASLVLSVPDVLGLLPFVGTVVVGRRLRQSLRSGSGRPFEHAWFLGFALASMLMSFSWFQSPMHDIALTFGSHGRWGCSDVNEDGSSVYLLRDTTMPFILFAPVLVATAGHWLARGGLRSALASRS